MKQALFTSLRLWIALTLLCGVVYPLIVTAYAQLLFAGKAQGSLIERDGKVVGSALIGQSFTGEKYFWGRPSATTPAYNASASSASNLAPNSVVLKDQVKQRAQKFAKTMESPNTNVPLDMITTSGSGLDPHISPESAYLQIPRIAKVRKLKQEELTMLVDEHVEDRQFGILGEKRVNVLQLNLALDAYAARR